MQIPYNSFNSFLKSRFPGIKVRKIPINAGFNCPNKNGDISDSGCIFCDSFGSGPISTFEKPIRKQIEIFTSRNSGSKFIAYYQAHSNTYAPPDLLRERYSIVFDYKDIVGLFIGTRPDSIPENVLPVLKEMKDRTYLSVELGLQSIHEKSLDFLNRNHTYDQFLAAFEKLRELQIDVIVHLIIGIPGENMSDMAETISEMNRLKPAGVKFHLLHVLKDTALFRMYERGEVTLMEKDEYINTVAELIGRLHQDIVVHRLTGERDPEIFHAPQWALDKGRVISGIHQRMKTMGLTQGSLIKSERNPVRRF